MIHTPFDIKRAINRFELDALREIAHRSAAKVREESPAEYRSNKAYAALIKRLEPHGDIVRVPKNIAVIEQARSQMAAEFATVERVQTDVFLWARGEPTDRRTTKVGGLPFWPRSNPWPIAEGGGPRRFYAQFCFADSSVPFDVIRDKVLVLFGGSGYPDSSTLEYHWVSASETDLVSTSDVPPSSNFHAYHGQIHRTWDYAKVPVEVAQVFHQADWLCVLEATKIGGLPSWPQGEQEVPGVFLCTLGSIAPHSGTPMPFANVDEPLTFGQAHNDRNLMWGDVGSINFFVDRQLRLRWAEQCY